MQLLNRQIAVVNFEPLRGHFLAVHTGTQAALPGLNAMPSMRTWLQRNASDKNPEKVHVCFIGDRGYSWPAIDIHLIAD